MPKIDLDAARAARREAAEDPPILVIEGKEYPLAVELPAVLLADISWLQELPEDMKKATPEQQQRVMAILDQMAASMIGDEWEAIRGKLTIDDLLTMLEQLAPVYGFESPGESSASAASS